MNFCVLCQHQVITGTPFPRMSESCSDLTTTTTHPALLLPRVHALSGPQMSSFCCTICLDTLDDAARPMSTQCGHIYCMDCATFRFSLNPSCAVCRQPQSLDNMIRLYPNLQTEETRNDASAEQSEDPLSSSPISVRSMDRAAEDSIAATKQAIADRVDPEDAMMMYVTDNVDMKALD